MAKYIVECEERVKHIYVVDAEDDEQCDKKLDAGEFEKHVSVVENAPGYFGYEYKKCEKYNGIGDEAVICSIDDLCHELGTTPDDLERFMFKNTVNGIPISWDKDGINLCAYAEGADDCGFRHNLLFPFAMKEFYKTLKYVEEESDELWRMWHDDTEEEEE